MLKSLVHRVMAQSDLTHASLAVGSTSLLLPVLPSLAAASLAQLHITALGVGVGTQVEAETNKTPGLLDNCCHWWAYREIWFVTKP